MAEVPFHGRRNATVSIAVSASSQRVQVGETGQTGTYSVRVQNDGTATVWLAFGDNTITTTVPSGSTAGGYRVPAGAVEVVTATGTNVAAIAAGATGNIYFTPGTGT